MADQHLGGAERTDSFLHHRQCSGNLGYAGGNVRITNSILSNSSHAPYYVDAKSTMEISYSLTDNSPFTGQLSNLDGNPLFENPSFFNYKLLPGSPALLTGFNNGISVDLGTQLPSAGFEPLIMIYQIYINSGNLDIPEFVALYNPSSKQVDLSGYSITKGITVTLPEGIYLEANDLLYLTDDVSASGWQSQTKQVIQWESGKLSNNGEAIQLEENHGIVIDYLEYENNGLWPYAGFSNEGVFQLISPGLDNHFPESWTTDSVGHIVSASAFVSQDAFTLYPNPTRDLITIKAPNYKQQRVEIYNLNGQLVGGAQLNEEGVATLDLSTFNSSILLIRVGSKVEKVVLIR